MGTVELRRIDVRIKRKDITSHSSLLDGLIIMINLRDKA